MSRDAPNAPYLRATETPVRSAIQRQEIAGELSGQLHRQRIGAPLHPLSISCQKNVKVWGVTQETGQLTAKQLLHFSLIDDVYLKLASLVEFRTSVAAGYDIVCLFAD